MRTHATCLKSDLSFLIYADRKSRDTLIGSSRRNVKPFQEPSDGYGLIKQRLCTEKL